MKTTNKMMKLPVRYYGFLAWIPASLALAYGSVSFSFLLFKAIPYRLPDKSSNPFKTSFLS